MYTMILLVFINGVLVPNVYMSGPFTKDSCRDKKVQIISGETEQVTFKVMCYKSEKDKE